VLLGLKRRGGKSEGGGVGKQAQGIMGKRKKSGSAPKKLIVEFDPEARKEYVNGMSRRKKQRREEALKNLEKQVREERKDIRKEVSE